MGENFQVKLSSGEILILAALLGYESVFGIEDSLLCEANTDLKTLIRQHVRHLERRKLIRYDLDGTLYIVPELRKAMDCICNAEAVGLFSTNLRSGKKASVYVMERESTVATVAHLSDGKYTVRLTDTVPLEELIPSQILSSQQHDMHEMMLMEEAEYVHQQIVAFNLDAAETRIQKHVKDKASAKLIAGILSGNCGYLSVRIYCKGKTLYNAVYNTMLVTVDHHTVSLNADENDVVCFEALSAAAVEEQLSRQFRRSVKRGAV